MRKRMRIMLISVGILGAILLSYQIFKSHMIKKIMAAGVQPQVVSATEVKYAWWQPRIKATASLRAVRGVDVTTEMAGTVRKIHFTPGSEVKESALLVELNIDADVARLHSLEAAAELAKTTYDRDKAQYEIRAVSKAVLDTDAADLKSKQAQVAEQAAMIAKKVIRAPFAGRLGVNYVNPGQYVNPGDKIVTLQTLDPIYIDFYVPQQQLVRLSVGQSVAITTDTYPGQTFLGKITTIDPKVDPATRNVQVEATIANAKHQLLPGMYSTAEVNTGAPKRYLTLPQTAVSYNPYGEIIYIIKQTGKDKKGQPILTVTQNFITVGEARGDQVAILKGLKEGDKVVTAGQMKLKNGSQVIINNAVVPSNNPAPVVTDE